MNSKKMRDAFIILMILLSSIIAAAQDINGDTVFVSTANQTWLTFKSEPKGKILKDAQDFAIKNTGKNVSLYPLKSNTKSTVLMVKEGGRTHNLVVLYKQNIDPLEASYNFSNIKKEDNSNAAATKENDVADKENKYNAAISKGNIAAGKRDYALALMSYREAQNLKPADAFVLKQIDYIQDVMTKDSLAAAEKSRIDNNKKTEAERLRVFNLGMAAYNRYEKAAGNSNYEEQVLNLREFLRLIDPSDLNKYQANTSFKIDFAKEKIRQINDYLTRTKGPAYQLEAVPYYQRDLQKKYPGVNFNAPPASQAYDPDSSSENVQQSKDFIGESSKTDINESTNNIKLAFTGISKKGNYLYLKYKVSNGDTAEFVAGSMQLILNKNKKKAISLNPVYISSFPIILPGKEFVIIYAIKFHKINDNETADFEINSRLKNLKLKVTIPGKLLAQE